MSNALTRIQNNQITDGTINAQYKLATGSITGNLLASTVTFNSNITILGNLTVANSYTQLNSINTYINDPVVVFNNNYVGSLTNYDIGILVNRNLASLGPYGSVNTFLGWSESAQAFIAVATTETGTNVSSINNSGYANLSIGNLSAVTGTFSGTLVAPSMTVPVVNATSGNITTLYSTNFSTGNAVITGGSISGTPISGSTGYFTTAQATNLSSGNVLLTGGSISGITNLNVTTETATNFASGNAQITGGAISGTPISGSTGYFTTAQATNFSSGNILVTGGSLSGITNLNVTTETAANFATGNAVITGGYAQGLANVYATTAQATNLSSGNAQITGGAISGTPISGSTGYFTTAQSNNLSSGNVLLTGGYAQGLANVRATEGQFTNLSSGNVLLTGGSISGLTNLNVTTETATNFASGNVQITGGSVSGITLSVASASMTTLQATNFSSGNAVITGGSLNGAPVGNSTPSTGAFTTLTNSGVHISNGNIVAASGTTSTSTTTGALVVAGGVGISGDAFIGGNLKVSGTLTYINTTTELVGGVEIVAGNLVANSGTASTNVSTGALVVQGGAGVSGAIYAGSIQNTPIGSTTASTGAFTTVTATGNVVAGSGTTSTNTTTGALVVVGGAGVSGNINVGGSFSQHSIKGNLVIGAGPLSTSTTALSVNQNTDAMLNSTAVVHISTLSGLAGKVTLDSFGNTSTFIARASAGTSTSPTAVQAGTGIGAFIARGYGATGYLLSNNTSSAGTIMYAAENFSDTNQGTSLQIQYIPTGANIAIPAIKVDAATGNIVMPGNGQSVSPTTGALVVRGGQGIVGNLWVGGYANIAGGFTAGAITNTPISGSTGSFTTLTATNETVTNFASGNVQILGGYINNLANITATNSAITTLVATNFSSANAKVTGGSIDGTPIGITTPAAGVFTNITSNGIEIVSGNLVAASGTTSFAPTTGAIVIAGTGGLGVGGNINVGQTLFVGTSHLTYSPQNAGVQFGASQNSFSQIVNQNANNGNNASTDFAAVANNGSDNDTYIDMGITGSGYSQSAYSLYGANDGYLIVAGNTTTGGGNLILNTYNANDIIFATGGTTKQFEVARITSGNVLVVKSTNNAVPAANTGAFQVWGGGSVTGNVYIGGAHTINGSQGAGNDVLIRGKNDATLIWARPNATYDSVIIGNSATAANTVVGAKVVINSTDSILLPVGTNSQRPSSSGGTDVQGMFRYSKTANGVEWYTGSAWVAATTSFTVIADQQFTGTGSQTSFPLTTITTGQTTASCIVSINGVVQIPTLAYSISGTFTGTGSQSILFTEPPASTDVIDVRCLTTTATVTQISSTNGYMQFLVDNNGAYVTTGAGSPTVTTTFLPNGAQLNTTPNVVVTTGNTIVDSFFANTYSSAEYTVTGTLSGTNIKEITKILVVTDGTNVYRTVYGVTTTTGNTLTSWSANVYNNSATLWATPNNANMIYRVCTNYQAV